MDSRLVRSAGNYQRYLRARRHRYNPPSGVGLEPRVLRLRRDLDRASRRSSGGTVDQHAVRSFARVRHPRRFFDGESSIWD